MPDVFLIFNRFFGGWAFAPRRSIYRSKALESRVPTVQALTYTDLTGRRFYRTGYGAPLMRLQSPESFAKLNAAIDRLCPAA